MDDSRDYRRVERAIRFLLENGRRRPTLEEAAAHLGLSPFHFQRLFLRFAGTTPARFVRYLSADEARARLVDARSVLDATLDLGLSSPGRLHDLLVSVHAVTPGEVRSRGAGLTIRHGLHDTPFGPARVALTRRGLTHLVFVDADDDMTDLERAWPRARFVEDPATTAPIVRQAFDPAPDGPPVPLHLRGTNLQLRVWEALLRIPEGAVVSYGSLAGALGRDAAARAVAGAVAANPVAYLIPCHRVLRATGAIGGYRWGVPRKHAMLARELVDAGATRRRTSACTSG